MDQMITPKPLINIIWTCQEMMVWMIMEMLGSVDVIWWDFGWEIRQQIKADCCQILTTNLTQHDSHGPDDHPKTIH
jgi:hypothetical protein